MKLNDLPVATYLVAGLTVIVAVVGGIVTITNPATLNFADYLTRLGEFVIATGVLGVGRAINLHGKAPAPRRRTTTPKDGH